MSKMVKVLVALLAITALVAPAVFAEDRLSLNGELRVRGWYKDNNTDFKDDNGSAATYFDQRFRLGGKIAVSEGVSVDFRYDLWDGTWGETNNTIQDGDNKAYMTIEKNNWMLRAGKQSHSLGNAIAIDTLGTGFIFDLKNVGLQLSYFKLDENNLNEADDKTLATVALSHSTDMYSGTVFGGFHQDGGTTAPQNDPMDIYVLGAAADFNLDAAKIKGEINWFDGETDPIVGNTKMEGKGLNLYLDASMAATETATVGAIFTYAKGYNGANESQVTDLSDDGSFMPETYGYMTQLFNIYPGTSLNATFDPTGDGLGTINGQLYTTIKLTDAFSVRGTVFYTETEEDYTTASLATDTTAYENFTGGVLSSSYTIAQGAAVDTMVAYVTTDAANSITADDAELIGGFRLRVRF